MKAIVLDMLYFIGFILLLKNNIVCYVRKIVSQNIFFVESKKLLYSQFSFFCIIGYFIFQFKKVLFEGNY